MLRSNSFSRPWFIVTTRIARSPVGCSGVGDGVSDGVAVGSIVGSGVAVAVGSTVAVGVGSGVAVGVEYKLNSAIL
ncbi:hypothetical protein D3C84_1122170 [compost metagenome]